MGLTRFAISKAIKLPKIESFQSFLFIGPHPDDIEIGAGATVAKLVRLGKKVTYLICTDGRYGKENIGRDISCEELAYLRKKESIEAAKSLGVEDVRFLDLSDGNQYDVKDLTRKMAMVINEVQPEVLFAPDPDTGAECHADHLNVGRAAKELANFASLPEILSAYIGQAKANTFQIKALCLYMSAKVNQYVKVSKVDIQKAKEAILCHASQYPKDHPATSSVFLYLKLRSIEFGFKSFARRAEAFRMLDKMRMHCLPEAMK